MELLSHQRMGIMVYKTPEQKACSKCKEVKSIRQFYLRDGIYPFGRCMDCTKIDQKKYYTPKKIKGEVKHEQA